MTLVPTDEIVLSSSRDYWQIKTRLSRKICNKINLIYVMQGRYAIQLMTWARIVDYFDMSEIKIFDLHLFISIYFRVTFHTSMFIMKWVVGSMRVGISIFISATGQNEWLFEKNLFLSYAVSIDWYNLSYKLTNILR